MKRTIIKIDENLCDGCGVCVDGCHEGALQLIDGKARLVSELYCDGLGACLGDCPASAITLEEREAEVYDEVAVMERLLPQGEKVIKAHLQHLYEHGQRDLIGQAELFLQERGIPIPAYKPVTTPVTAVCPKEKEKESFSVVAPAVGGGCPGNRARIWDKPQVSSTGSTGISRQQSELRQWPVQLHLLSPVAPYWEGADVLVAADCTAFAAGDFHTTYLCGKKLAIACPKLDEGQDAYIDKLTQMIDEGGIRSLTVLIMEVPCCRGLFRLCRQAWEQAKRKVPMNLVRISLQGELLE